ncbi:Type 1 glutamine amidotransferase-like domain-containing protein [Candidatus Dojkabacteria bacterium]|uniref:Type 1 glutamine amidotransferase-like domain-containing protein n=1 Tax=Candidatus Dojkabacteria bacterium TaxID=2099670 RepID=A0A955L1B2_9BACT|nr:Type 1 glutamine amidotransferase-like domain-containing protein [Candidatus Dojkabacteria bacterium]
MSKLILASNTNFLDILDLNDYLDIPIQKAKVLYIITGSNRVHDDSFVKRHLKRVAERNLNYTSYDIEGKSETEISKTMEDYDIIHMEGGNTFHILRTIYDTSFNKILKKRLDEGMNYIGTSAGSYVMTPSIITATWNDRDFDRSGLEDFSALNYVPFVLKAHYSEDRKQSILDNVSGLSWPLRILTDDQAIAVNNDDYNLIGNGPEITLERLQNQ